MTQPLNPESTFVVNKEGILELATPSLFKKILIENCSRFSDDLYRQSMQVIFECYNSMGNMKGIRNRFVLARRTLERMNAAYAGLSVRSSLSQETYDSASNSEKTYRKACAYFHSTEQLSDLGRRVVDYLYKKPE